MAVAYKGGKCARCGYARSVQALVFHHRNAGSKDFAMSESGVTRSWQAMKRELGKCELVCANCHAEIHARQHADQKSGETPGEFGE